MVAVETNLPAQAGKTILLIEDDALLSKMYGTKLSSEGFNVVKATDGVAGLKLALEINPNIIVLDVMMPKLSGLEVLSGIKANPVSKNIPVLMMSNLADGTDQKALALGANEYLIKPNLTPMELVNKIKQYIH